MRRRALLSLAACAALATMASSCLSPTLPLPPPDHPDAVTAGMGDLWGVSGTCIAGAMVTVWNPNGTPHGSVVEDITMTGNYSLSITGNACDVVWVTQTVGTDTSTQTTFVLQAWQNGGPVDPTSCP